MGVATALSYVFRQLAAGGGAKEIAGRINVADIGVEVSALKVKYGNILQIPTYFAYILRSFSILEGIGLSNNPDYQIVQGCYPYIARRLFNDDSERAKAALHDLVVWVVREADALEDGEAPQDVGEVGRDLQDVAVLVLQGRDLH